MVVTAGVGGGRRNSVTTVSVRVAGGVPDHAPLALLAGFTRVGPTPRSLTAEAPPTPDLVACVTSPDFVCVCVCVSILIHPVLSTLTRLFSAARHLWLDDLLPAPSGSFLTWHLKPPDLARPISLLTR